MGGAGRGGRRGSALTRRDARSVCRGPERPRGHATPRLASVGAMFAVYADSFSADDPLSGLVVGERPEPEVPDGWTTVTVKAASLNHHDLWSLRGVGLRQEALPMILGCDAAGLDEDGNEVLVHGVISRPAWRGDETLDPGRSLLSERYQGTFAEKVAVPRAQRGPQAGLAVASRRRPACRRPG